MLQEYQFSLSQQSLVTCTIHLGMEPHEISSTDMGISTMSELCESSLGSHILDFLGAASLSYLEDIFTQHMSSGFYNLFTTSPMMFLELSIVGAML